MLTESDRTEREPVSLLPALSTLQIGLGTNGVIGGGAERVFAELADHLPEYRVSFSGAVVFGAPTRPGAGAYQYVFAPEGASVPRRLLSARSLTRRLLREGTFDLVASHFALYSFPSLDIIRAKPFVVHFHGPWSAESIEEGSGRVGAWVKRQVETKVYRQADRVIVLSQAFAKLLHREYGVDEELIRVVPGSVNIERFHCPEPKAVSRERLGWPQDRPILVSVRRLAHRVGLDLLIAAMPRVVAACPEVLLYLGGRGPLREALELQVRDLGMEQHVRFLGFLSEEDLPHAYHAADFNVVPTRAFEGFGLVAAEALAAGTPSLVTPIGGLPEVIGPLSSNLIFRSADPEGIAEGIIQALLGRVAIPDSTECRKYAETHFSSSLMAARTAEVYREIAPGTTRGTRA